MAQYKYKKNKRELTLNNLCSGFTLMEVLVSSSIFALILIFTTAAVSQSSGYQSKLSMLNKTSEETRRFADMISSDVRGANSELKINAKICEGAQGTYSFKNGLAILKLDSNGNYCLDYQFQKNENDPSQSTQYTGRALIIANKDGYKIYVSKVVTAGESEGVYYKPLASAIVPGGVIQVSDITSGGELVSKSNLLVNIKFGGFAPEDGGANYGQPIVKFDITAIAPDTSIVKGQSEIRSAVTSRSYN